MESRPENRDDPPLRLPPHDTIEGFAARVKLLFARTGLSTSTFERLRDFALAGVEKRLCRGPPVP
ncbi:hypothetical protein [Streptomyces albipurpureus]|uniref:Uncharacterized protein n=1 Tax=Streptomyces albipurpureus TaxID=2897419 RepID=A0ABT0UJA5_9ACTN|nr:hypothetical protein [Streptomyces sp. CWNU-1]MCM2388266.1 hypothetical protein [Streptomyces sp. CWNU-1]